jgi:hypothetical protein
MVIQHRELAPGDREDASNFLQAIVDPEFTIAFALAEQEIAADAAGDVVVPAGDGGINTMRACNRHGCAHRGWCNLLRSAGLFDSLCKLPIRARCDQVDVACAHQFLISFMHGLSVARRRALAGYRAGR